MIHYLAIDPAHLKDQAEGKKLYEVRKLDRPYSVGDIVAFPAADYSDFPDAPRAFEIIHILTWRIFPQGLKRGFGILSLKPIPATPFDFSEVLK